MPDRVLVTGISGYLGGHVAVQLLEAGYVVRGSLRDGGRADRVRNALAGAGADVSRLEFVSLDLMSDKGWAGAMEGVRYLQHVASPFVTRMPADRMELVRPAVEGTRRALEAAFASSVEKVVLTSSMAAIAYGHDPRRTEPFTASDWTNLAGPGVNAYTESKTRAEQAAWEIADRAGRRADLSAINPSVILGPLLDDDPGTSVALAQRLLKGGMPVAPRLALGVVDVRDVAAIHLAAITTPKAGGRRFPATAGTYSLMQLAKMVRAAMPERAGKLPRWEAPDWLTRFAALFDKDLRGNVGELGVFRRMDASDAEALLGRPFIPANETLVATARSLIQHGLI